MKGPGCDTPRQGDSAADEGVRPTHSIARDGHTLRRLFVAVRDSTLGEVVRREFQRNSITVHDLDAIPPESSGHGRQHCSAGIQLYRKHSSFELFYNLTEYFDCVFFWQIFFNLS